MYYMNSQYQHSYCEVSGTPYEQGVQQGRELKEDILYNLQQVYQKLDQAKVDREAYQDFCNRNIRFMEAARPELYEEMMGIAEGSGLTREQILLINIPTYFLAEKFTKITQDCSMICVGGNATVDHHTYIIKNRDMGCPALKQALVKHIYPDGEQILEVSGAGTLTFPAVGINRHGLAVTTTGFWSEKNPTRIELVEEADIFLNVRVLLSSCKTAAEAVEFCRTAPHMNGLNVLVADPQEAYVMEMTSGSEMFVEKMGEDGILFRTNHLISEELKHLNMDEDKIPSSIMRYKRIEEMLSERKGSLRFQDLLRIMSDHKYEPNCICRHPHEGVPAHTVSTTLCDVQEFEIWTSLDNMCTTLPHARIEME